ncbi:hypothetical protein [Streptomyces sp. NPDC127098]|uniref:hypothetical protein n=1 Tax=Streptomyces sp. NPDC127098 TaxID=3347137 RepID=UPI0036530DD1
MLIAADVAAAPAEATPGVMDGEILGQLGTGGAALVVTVVLWLGMKATADKGRQLPWGVVLLLGAMSATLYAAAGGFWSMPADILGELLIAVGVGTGTGPAGNVGMGAVACVCAAVIYWRKLTLPQLAVMGFVAAYVAGRAGGIWGVGADLLASLGRIVGA